MFNRYKRSFNARGTGSDKYRRFNRFGGGARGRNRRGMPSAPVQTYVTRATTQTRTATPEIKPTVKVETLNIDQRLKKTIMDHGYEYLMPIQEKGIPVILEGKDVIGIANTGTGKTAAFLIPIIQKVMNDPTYRALIITPTRELALQIREEMRSFTRGIPVSSTFCIGQSSMGNQIYELRRNPHVVIGTPGRLKDLIERRVLNLSTFKMIVLDEADQMLDMGFLPDIKHIISFLPSSRQSLFFSATVSSQINTLIQSFVKNPVTISVKVQETVSHISQKVIKVDSGKTKMAVLSDLLKQEDLQKVLVFGRTKMGVERLGRELYNQGYKVASIHGDKPQFKRQQAIRMFKEDVVNILVATDVAARGLDISNITHVINYDPPATYEDYIHRIGRTGRANNKGVALTFAE